jgi:hypothetical protein
MIAWVHSSAARIRQMARMGIGHFGISHANSMDAADSPSWRSFATTTTRLVLGGQSHRATICHVGAITDDQLDLLRRVMRAGGSFTATRMESHELRLLVSLGRVLERRGLVRVMSSEAGAYVELTEAGREQAEWDVR